MIRSKVLFPVLAIILAVASAFATVKKPAFVQQGWYDSNGAAAGGGMLGNITTPSADEPVCSLEATRNICKIQVNGTNFNAFNSQPNAETGGGVGSTGLLKYDPQ